MQENDFFTWRRSMLVRFQEMATAEDVYTELQHQTQQLEYDYYALCVRHPSRLRGQKSPFTPRTRKRGWRIISLKTISLLIRY